MSRHSQRSNHSNEDKRREREREERAKAVVNLIPLLKPALATKKATQRKTA